jgi:hypothetical protein
MMTDRELLELAAKAASIELTSMIGETFWKPDGVTWNPLTDDADALRLAVSLGLKLTMPKYKGFGTTADHQSDGIAGCTAFDTDPMAQTRRAIVIAAANVSRGAA